MIPLYPAILGWGVRRGCVFLGSGFGCAPPLLAGVLGSACWCACSPCTPPLLARVCGVGLGVGARVWAAPCHSRLGCWGVCVLVCVLPLHPATCGRVVLPGCLCLGPGFGCAPPLLAGVLGRVRAGVRAPPVPRHSWLGCALWVCALGLGFRLRPATPGWGLWCVGWLFPGTCSCAVVLCLLCALPGFAAPGGRCCLAPSLVPWLWPAACLSGVPHGPALVRNASSGPVAFGAPVGFPVAVVPFPTQGGLLPRPYWVAARGTRRLAENRAHCACRWPAPRQGHWARSASYPFGAQRWGCPWRVPPALVLGCVRCGVWRVWTRSLTCPVSRTARLSTGDSAGAPGLFCVGADTPPFGSEDARKCCPGSLMVPEGSGPARPVGQAGEEST